MEKQLFIMKLMTSKSIPFKRNSIASILYGIIFEVSDSFSICFNAIGKTDATPMVRLSFLEDKTSFSSIEILEGFNTLLSVSEIEYHIDTNDTDLIHYKIFHQGKDELKETDSDLHVSPTEAAKKKAVVKKKPTKKERIEYPKDFEEILINYPKRRLGMNKKMGYQSWSARIAEGESVENLLQATKNYFISTKDSHGTSYIMMLSTFFGSNERYAEFLNIEEDIEINSEFLSAEGVESKHTDEELRLAAMKLMSENKS